MIGDMVERIFSNGAASAKTIQGETRQLPLGLGAYTLGFPCTPWSMRGRRGGFEDENSQPFQVGVQTILSLKPLTWTLECVCCSVVAKSVSFLTFCTRFTLRHDELHLEPPLHEVESMSAARPGQSGSDYEIALNAVTASLGGLYLILVYRRMHPTRFGYPEQRPRPAG